jgi:hypothetical protein
MAEVISDHIWYPDGYPGSAYDLRQVTMWWVAPNPLNVLCRINGTNTGATVEFNAAAFEAAKQNSLDNGG